MQKKVAAVTGSYRGIGLGIIDALATAGYAVIMSGSALTCNPDDFLSKENQGTGQYIKCDISNPSDRKAFFAKIAKDYGRLDVLVNNAGVAPKERLDILETTTESFQRLMSINLEGTFFMCQSAANYMIKTKKSTNFLDYAPRIVNIASISSYTSSTNRGEYCISKAGISMVTSLFADKLAEYGIPVFEVRPGVIVTDMTAAVTEKYQKLVDEGLTPIKRLGKPKDVADCVMALMDGKLDFATGQVINADGGFHIRRL